MAAAADTDTDDVAAYYLYTRAETVDDARAGYEIDDRVRTRFVDVIDTIVDGIDRGCFPAYPGEPDYDPRARRETFGNCQWCPYDRLCPVDRGTAWARQSSDEAMEPFWRLELDDDEDGGS
jgi:PD-(D/E)XK nuclease superfamily